MPEEKQNLNQDEKELAWQRQMNEINNPEENLNDEDQMESGMGVNTENEADEDGDDERDYKMRLAQGKMTEQLQAQAKKVVMDKAKAEVKKKVEKAILKKILMSPAFWTVVFWVVVGAVGLVLIIYIVAEPCEVAKFVGAWWSTLLGATCGAATGGTSGGGGAGGGY